MMEQEERLATYSHFCVTWIRYSLTLTQVYLGTVAVYFYLDFECLSAQLSSVPSLSFIAWLRR